VAKDKCQSVARRQASEFLIENDQPLAPRQLGLSIGMSRVRFRDVPGRSAPCVSERFAGNAAGDAMQPTAQRFALADRGSVAREHEKGCLAGVFSVVLIAQHASADAQHHRSVSLHDRAESSLVPLRAEAPK
jgi:hypothetical protein